MILTVCDAETEMHGPAPSGSVVVHVNVIGELLTSFVPGVYAVDAEFPGLKIPFPVVDHVPRALVVAVIGKV